MTDPSNPSSVLWTPQSLARVSAFVEETIIANQSGAPLDNISDLIAEFGSGDAISEAVSRGIIRGMKALGDESEFVPRKGQAVVALLCAHPHLHWAAQRAVAAFADFLLETIDADREHGPASPLNELILTLKDRQDLLSLIHNVHLDAYLEKSRSFLMHWTFGEIREIQGVAATSSHVKNLVMRADLSWILISEKGTMADGGNYVALAYGVDAADLVKGSQIIVGTQDREPMSCERAIDAWTSGERPAEQSNVPVLFRLAFQAMEIHKVRPDLFVAADQTVRTMVGRLQSRKLVEQLPLDIKTRLLEIYNPRF